MVVQQGGDGLGARSVGGYGPLGFRPLLRGLVLADGWAMAASPSVPAIAAVPWPEAWLQVAEQCATGRPVSPAVWHQALAVVDVPTAEERTLVDLVVATPWLLLQANPHGHHREAIQSWGQALGLSPTTGIALVDYAQRLGQPGWTPSLEDVSQHGNRWRNGMGANQANSLSCPEWADLVALVASLPGQWPLALALAQRWGWPSAALALVGLLSAGSGLGSLPWLSPTDVPLGPRWLGYTLAQIDALADALHDRWAGVHPRSRDETPIMAKNLRVV